MKYFKTYEGYKLGVNGVGSLRNSLAALKRQNVNGRYVDPEILAKAIRNEYEAITGEKYEDEVQMSMDNTIADIIGHYKLDGPDFMAAWDKVVKESIVNEKETLASAIEKEMDNNRFNVDVEFFTRDLRQIQNTKNHKDLHPSIKKVLKALKKKYRIRESELNEGSDQQRLTHLRKFGIAPNNQPQNAAYIKQVSKPGKFFVDWKDAFKLGDVALEFIKSVGSISEFDIIDLKTMKRTGKQLDVKKGQLGNLRTTYGVRVNESVNDASNNLEKIFGTDQETMDMFQGIEDKGTVKDMIEFIDEFGNEEMLSRYGIKSAAQVKKLAKTIMGESVNEEKDFEPHMMYDPKTGKGYKAEKQEDHDRMDKLGYVHEKPEEVTESYEGNFTDFKYDLEMAIDNMDLSPKAIKSVKKKGKGYEVRLSSYMSDKSTWEKIGDTIGATLISFKPGSINIGIYE